MANTVSILSYNNTFGDLLAQQNKVAVELNNLGSNNYTKDSGTIFISSPGTGLSMTGSALIGSIIVANTFAVTKDSTFLANSFFNGPGQSVVVENSALVYGTTTSNNIIANTITSYGTTLTMTPPTVLMTSTTLSATNTTGNFNTLSTVGDINIGGNEVVTGNVTINGSNTGLFVANNATVANTITSNTVVSNTITGFGSTLTLTPTILSVTSPTLSAPDTAATFNTISAIGGLQVGGNFVLTGSTVYATNTFTVAAGLVINSNAKFSTYRPTGANADIRWNEASQYYDLNDVNNGNFYNLL